VNNLERLDIIIKGIVATLGGIVSFIVGGIGFVVSVLIVLMVADFITAIMACKYNGKKISSDIGAKGIIKKTYVLILLFCVYLFEKLGLSGFGIEISGFTGDALAFMFCVIELVSIIENGDEMGARLPEPIRKFFKAASKYLDGKDGDGK